MKIRLKSLSKHISVFVLVLFLSLLSANAQVSIYQAVTQSGTLSTGTGGTPSATWSLQCGGSSPLVLVIVHYTGSAFNNCTYNGSTFNGVTEASGNSDNVAIFYFNSPATGTNNVTLTASGNCTFYANAIAFSNASNEGQSITVTSSSGSSASITQSGLGSNDMIIGGTFIDNNATISIPSGNSYQQALFGSSTNPYNFKDGYVMASKSSTIGWDFSKSGNYSIWATHIKGSSPLPISLLNFNASYFAPNNSVNITWSTATETDNKLFTIEKTTDGVNYTEVATTPGAGNSDQVLNYSIVDETPSAGTSYYRLKQTDYDGNYTYSQISTVNIAASYNVTLAPNPVGNATTLRYSSNDTQPLNVRIFDMSGQMVSEYNFSEVQAGENNFGINTSALPAGTYIMQLDNGNHVTSRKFVK